MAMPRYQITIEYDGTNFSGWQRQADTIAIQEILEDALFSFSKNKVISFASGRTDKGVHAIGQVVHFDLLQNYHPHEVQNALNFYLKPNPIVITNAKIVADDFHARFHARKRYYKYLILNRNAPSVLSLNRVWHIKKELDIENMIEAAEKFIGQHDFTSFRAKECQAKSPIRTIDEFWIKKNDDIIEIHVAARSFLHHQVRNMVGALKQIGIHKLTPSDIPVIIAAKNREKAPETAPACGLYFMKVEF